MKIKRYTVRTITTVQEVTVDEDLSVKDGDIIEDVNPNYEHFNKYFNDNAKEEIDNDYEYSYIEAVR